MATTRRSATFSDTPEILWATVADPHHLPRWWPGVQRVEDVDPGSFTQVSEGRRGRTVRADYAVVEQTDGRRCRWRRKPAGSPVERIRGRAEVTIELSAQDPAASGGATAGTKVTLTLRQAAGSKPFGTVRRAGRAELEQALAELGRIHG
jgi:uncharacterized protein YndB with AHSA1/START domain